MEEIGDEDKIEDLTTIYQLISSIELELDTSISELLTYPEQDYWLYKSKQFKRAFTSSEFVIAAFQQLGVFEGLEINAAEFTPRNVYQLDIFDKDFKKPEVCNTADIRLDYCQVMGDTRMLLDEYSTRLPSSWMGENCPNPFRSNKREVGC